jgi:hypothetical protein
MLAEYLVGKALGCLGPFRREWIAWDFTFEGRNIEVKSAGFVQSWDQPAPSKVRFSIAPAKNAYGEDQKTLLGPGHHAHVYVFCLHTKKDRERAGRLELDSWQLYVVSTAVLEAAVGQQKSISLDRLEKMATSCSAAKATWHTLKQEVSAAIRND